MQTRTENAIISKQQCCLVALFCDFQVEMIQFPQRNCKFQKRSGCMNTSHSLKCTNQKKIVCHIETSEKYKNFTGCNLLVSAQHKYTTVYLFEDVIIKKEMLEISLTRKWRTKTKFINKPDIDVNIAIY